MAIRWTRRTGPKLTPGPLGPIKDLLQSIFWFLVFAVPIAFGLVILDNLFGKKEPEPIKLPEKCYMYGMEVPCGQN